MTLSSRRHWPALALTWLALAVRLYNLSYHSLWFDEAMSVYWARSTTARILEVSMNLVEDRLPPLYYLLLHYWRLLLGDGELAVRLPSVLLGTLLVPILYRLGLDLFRSRRIAALAGPTPQRAGILAPCVADAELDDEVARLRGTGEIVIADLPGHSGARSELGCDRSLELRDGRWTIVPLGGA